MYKVLLYNAYLCQHLNINGNDSVTFISKLVINKLARNGEMAIPLANPFFC